MMPIRSTADAEQAVNAMAGLMERLRGVLEQETELVRAGKVRTATALAATKSELAGQLFTGSERLRANAQFVRQSAPASCAGLARAQEAFRAVLQRNMMVLATAHAVSEGIVRRLSGDLARKRVRPRSMAHPDARRRQTRSTGSHSR